jgi:hypothetical protein
MEKEEEEREEERGVITVIGLHDASCLLKCLQSQLRASQEKNKM